MVAKSDRRDSQPRREKLTEAIVSGYQPEAKRFTVWDTDCTGLGLRVAPSGRKTFVCRYRTKAGTIREPAIGKWPTIKVRSARETAGNWTNSARTGGDPSLDRKNERAADTVAKLADRFIREHAKPYCKPRTVALYEDLLDRYIRGPLGTTKAAAVTRADIERLHQRIGRDKPPTANRVLQLLSVLFNKAEHWGTRPQNTNPCAGVKRFKENPRERFLSPDERATLDRVLEQTAAKRRGEPGYVSPGAVLAVRLLAATGARCGEITELRWSMVDLDGARLNLPDSKTGKKTIPISPQAVTLLRDAMPERVFPKAYVCASERGTKLSNMERAWQAIRSRAGLDDVRLHDLRHSAASDAIAAGLPLPLIGALLGHKSSKTTQRYAHLADDVARAAAERMGAAIEGRTKSGTAQVIPIKRGRRRAKK